MNPETARIVRELGEIEERRRDLRRTTTDERYPMLSQAEADFYRHMERWGSEGYPILKRKPGHWTWHEFCGVRGAPSPYKTKRAATAAIELFLSILLDKISGRITV